MTISFQIEENMNNIEGIISLVSSAHAEGRFGHFKFSSKKVENIVSEVILSPKNRVIMTACHSEKVQGLIFGTVGEHHISNGLVATIHNVNTRADIRKTMLGGKVAIGLINGFRSWARQRNAHEVLFHVTSGVDLARSHKLAKHLGFEFIGGSYVG